ncbi:MAG: 6,7-dimethyl-8-ribityllumazine synthase [Acetobacteraceae bacterium]
MSTADAPEVEPPAIAGPAPHLLLVRAPYYREVVDALSRGAERILGAAGARFETLDVAGAFELPQAIRLAVRGPARHDGFIALGCVVRGETDHYDHICRETMGGLMRVALQFGLALGTGLLTVDRLEQALARARPAGPNKGAEAARAALLQIAADRRFRPAAESN